MGQDHRFHFLMVLHLKEDLARAIIGSLNRHNVRSFKGIARLHGRSQGLWRDNNLIISPNLMLPNPFKPLPTAISRLAEFRHNLLPFRRQPGQRREFPEVRLSLTHCLAFIPSLKFGGGDPFWDELSRHLTTSTRCKARLTG